MSKSEKISDADVLKALLATMDEAEKKAAQIVRTAIDCYNSKDGSGRFVNVTRYQVLERQVAIAGTGATSLPQFWAKLLKAMEWSVPPSRFYCQIMDCLTYDKPHEILKTLTERASFVVMVAHQMHRVEKPKVEYVETEDLKEDLLS